MELKWPWLAVLLAVAVIALLVLWLRRRAAPRSSMLVAHSARLRQVPRFRRLARRQLAVTGLRTMAALVLTAGAILLASRPIRVEVIEPDRSARDVQLCLDVSPSMDRWNARIADEFGRLAQELSGERIGLTIFNATAVTIFPLTDDYEFIADRLEEAELAFSSEEYEFFVGTLPLRKLGDQLVPDAGSASQIGDGLAGCLERFDDADDADDAADERGRAVVLASDNRPIGPPVFTLPQAVDQALREDVTIYGLGPPNLGDKPESLSGFEAATSATGGTLTRLESEEAVDDVVAGIQQLERARLDQAPQATELDDSRNAFLLAAAGLALLLVASLIGRRS